MARPSLAKLPFLPKVEEPTDVWKKCVTVLDKWEKKLSFEGKYAKDMEEFRTKMVVKTIFISNVLEDTIPKEVSMNTAEEALTKAYEDVDQVSINGKGRKGREGPL